MRSFLFISFFLLSFLHAALPTGRDLLTDALSHMNPKSSEAIMKQTIITTSGDKRVLTYKTFSNKNGKNSIMRYLSPSRVRGNALLLKNYSDDIWMYNRRTRRVRKLASHAKKQKFEGSDFTYEDMGSGDSWKEDYTAENVGGKIYQDQPCTILKLTAKSNTISYSKLILLLRKADNFPLKIDYYDKSSDLLKTLKMKDIEKIQSIPTAMKMVMINQQDNTRTKMAYESVKYNVDFRSDFFSERQLKR